jgi:hypothetical protein
MNQLTYPTSAELKAIEQVLMPRLTKQRPIFDDFPMREVDAHRLMWEQLDNFIGLQQVRGLNGAPQRVLRVGLKAYDMKPGVYGEFSTVDEEEITIRRAQGKWGEPVDISDLVTQIQNQLLLRRLDRIESIVWTLITAGIFSVATAQGQILHTDSFPILTFTASVPWATSATATPLQNFRSIQLLSRGQSVDFGATSNAWMNRTTFNLMVSNTNQNDLAGRRVTGLLSPLNLEEINRILLGEGLPQVKIYDQGYIDDTNTFQLFIPNNTVAVIGNRPQGQRVGEYRMTRNANNTRTAPGPYTKVIDTMDREVPRRIDVHDGHNGGPVVWFPGALVRMNV